MDNLYHLPHQEGELCLADQVIGPSQSLFHDPDLSPGLTPMIPGFDHYSRSSSPRSPSEFRMGRLESERGPARFGILFGEEEPDLSLPGEAPAFSIGSTLGLNASNSAPQTPEINFPQGNCMDYNKCSMQPPPLFDLKQAEPAEEVQGQKGASQPLSNAVGQRSRFKPSLEGSHSEVEQIYKIQRADQDKVVYNQQNLPNEQSRDESPVEQAIKKKRTRKRRLMKPADKKCPGFKRSNDLQFLHEGYDELERRLVEISKLGKTSGAKSKLKQKLWNQVSSLKCRLRTRQQNLFMVNSTRQKDSRAEKLIRLLKEVASPSQFRIIQQITLRRWMEADKKADLQWPVDIQEEGTLLQGKLRPAQPEKEQLGARSRPSSLFENIQTPEYVFKYFQPNEEQDG